MIMRHSSVSRGYSGTRHVVWNKHLIWPPYLHLYSTLNACLCNSLRSFYIRKFHIIRIRTRILIPTHIRHMRIRHSNSMQHSSLLHLLLRLRRKRIPNCCKQHAAQQWEQLQLPQNWSTVATLLRLLHMLKQEDNLLDSLCSLAKHT